MKFFFLFIILFFSISCSTILSRNPSSENKPRHVVITVHGLSGNAATWGYFSEATKPYLETLDPKYEVNISNFIYPTGKSEEKGAFDFADNLGQYIKDQFKDRPLGKDDKISLVCHSQGGVISYIWFISHIFKQDSDFEYVKHLDSIITLGTPFWGSKLASILTDKRNVDIIPFIKLFAPPEFQMTRHEIADMAFASDTVNMFRNLAIELDSDERLGNLIENLPVRLINVSGLLPVDKNKIFVDPKNTKLNAFSTKVVNMIYSLFQKNGFGGRRVESDIAVIVPSSRWNFIYSTPQKINSSKTIESSEFKHFKHLVNKSKFLFTESVHLPFDNENTLSMAYINRECLSIEGCKHPTYRYILEQLANCKEENCDTNAYENIIQKLKVVEIDEHKSNKTILDSLQAFTLQVNIKLKQGQIDKFPVQYFERMYSSKNGDTEGLDIWRLNEPYMLGKVFDLNYNKKTQISNASTQNYQIYIGQKDESHSVDIVSRYANEADPFDRLRFNVTGYVDNKIENKNQPYTVPLTIRLPGLPEVKINAVVQPSYSTYVELDYTE